MDKDTFVERAVHYNKWLTADQIDRAKAVRQGEPDRSLLDVMIGLGFLASPEIEKIEQLYERAVAQRAPAAAPVRPGASPVSGPASDIVRAGGSEGGPATGPVDAVAPDAPVPPPQVHDPDRVTRLRTLDDFLGYAREIGASDFHVHVGYPPAVRRHGRLTYLPREPLTAEQAEDLLFEKLTVDQAHQLRAQMALDFCYQVEGQGRYRSCIVKQRTGWDGAFRVIAARVPTFGELALPEHLRSFTEFHQGLVLITGPNGCGKSTTMAALVELVNQSREDHIITLEDPIEYEFVPAQAQINQREVGTHTTSFAAALRAALREDPDVIMIGELRDLETISLAISAAETGHLVFGTLHTTSAARTIDRILDVFPPDDQEQIRAMISESIRGIICQQLLPRKDGSGRVMALEVMFNTPAVANLIRERKLFQMPSILQTGRKQGMILLDNSLLSLVNEGVIDGEDAYFAADNKGPFQKWSPKVEIGTGEKHAGN